MDGTNYDPYFVRTGRGNLNLDVQSGHLFWSHNCRPAANPSEEPEDCSAGIVGRADVDGTGLKPELVSPVVDVTLIGANSTHVYWLERTHTDWYSGRPNPRYVGRARLDSTEVDHRWFDVEEALDGSFVGNSVDLEVDGDYIYVGSEYAITRIALDRSSFTREFVSMDNRCCSLGIAVGDSYIYFGYANDGERTGYIGRVSKDGTGPVDRTWISGHGLNAPWDLEASSIHLYWTDRFTGSVGRARLDGSEVQPNLITTPPKGWFGSFQPAGLALDETPTAPAPPHRENPTATGRPGGGGGGGGGGSSADPTAGAAQVCIELRGGTRKRTKAVPGGGQVLQTVSQSTDPALPIKVKAGARRGAKIASAVFKVNKKVVASTGTTANVPVGVLKLGKRNRVSSELTLKDGRKITVNEIIVVLKCPLPPVTCQRASAGTRLKCSSSMPRRARAVKVTVAGPNGARANGSAKVKLRKDGKKGEYSMTMKPNATLPPGKYLYKHVATTTRKGEKLLATRILTLE